MGAKGLLTIPCRCSRSGPFGPGSLLLYDMTKPAQWAGYHVMVEMMGVEPMSESISTGFSPSAAYALLIRVTTRP